MPPSGSHEWQKQLCCRLIQKDWLICALSEEYLTTFLLSSLTKCIQQILQKRQTKEKLKYCLKKKIAITILRSLKRGQKMSVGVFRFMLQLLVYVREKYKNFSNLFGAFEDKLRGLEIEWCRQLLPIKTHLQPCLGDHRFESCLCPMLVTCWLFHFYQAPVVQTLLSAIHRINHYPVYRYQGNQLRYPLDRFLSSG